MGEGSGVTRMAKDRLNRVDTFQQRHPAVGVPVAVVRKFSEDKSTELASMIAFWAFFSVFPLLLVFITLLGFLVPAAIQTQVLNNVAARLPLIDTSALHGLSGSWWALIIGLLTSLWSGLSVVKVTQSAFNSVWDLPPAERPKFLVQVGRSLGVLITVGFGLVISTLISGFVAGSGSALHIGWLANLAGYVIAIALDVGLFIAAFRMLTDRQVTTRDVLPGAVLAGVLFWILQSLSSLIISHYLTNAQGTYGHFATVLTLLWWFYLQSILTLVGAQLNVVLTEHLHPRALVNAPRTEADHRAYHTSAPKGHGDEHVTAEFPDRAQPSRRPST
jgi:membrane protein